MGYLNEFFNVGITQNDRIKPYSLVRELLTNNLFTQFPQPFSIDFIPAPRINLFWKSDSIVVKINAIVFC